MNFDPIKQREKVKEFFDCKSKLKHIQLKNVNFSSLGKSSVIELPQNLHIEYDLTIWDKFTSTCLSKKVNLVEVKDTITECSDTVIDRDRLYYFASLDSNPWMILKLSNYAISWFLKK